MKTILSKSIIFTFILSLFLTSCGREDKYYYLTDEAKSLLIYEVGDNFNLYNSSTGEIITCFIDTKSDGGEFSINQPKFSGTNDHLEKVNYTYSDATDCYQGTFEILADENDNFSVQLYLRDCFTEYINSMTGVASYNYHSSTDDELTNIQVNGKSYPNTYTFESDSTYLYYSPQIGILQITDKNREKILFTTTRYSNQTRPIKLSFDH
ncbi:MAG: hypothetical protein Kapaf2KO_05000 [Candidatus Kapaibacteriales bacterium]